MKGKHTVLGMILFVLALSAVAAVAQPKNRSPLSLQVKSAAFQNGDTIPVRHTCDGKDVSPPLAWDAPPTGTLALALIADDPDAPGGAWVHWVLFNLPPDTSGLPDQVPRDKVLENGARQGMNDFRSIGYRGPCPPPGHGPHRYFFKVYALDAKLDLPAGSTKPQVEKAMADHVIARGELMGKYERKK